MKKLTLDKRTVFEIILIAVIIALAVVCCIKLFDESKVMVYYYTPTGTIEDGPYTAGSLVEIRTPEDIEGYTFAGWKNEQGNIETRNAVYVNEDTYFSAVYSVGFENEEHILFLTNDEGVFRPDDPITKSECAIMFYKLLNIDTVGSGEFLDVTEEDECYTACATLKDLGIFTGNYFHPEDYVSRSEFKEMLSAFSKDYPSYLTDSDSDDTISRSQVADVVCRILGRTGDTTDNKELVGTFLDVSPNNEYFWAIAESTIDHDFEIKDGNEVWTDCDSFPNYEPGFFFVNYTLHYIDENGNPVIEGSAEGLNFNSRGEETSGDDMVDKYVKKILEEVINPDEMSKSEMLKALYTYMITGDKFRYLTRNYYEVGDTSWVTDEALTMLRTHKGNCYNFAAVFYELARAIGYDAKIYSGTMGTDYRPHAWVEIDRNGEPMLYDVEYQYAHSETNMYQRDSDFMERYHYHKDAEEIEEAEETVYY